jgi:phosphatidylglycerol:prolipoprotein diacylglycerol transferase
MRPELFTIPFIGKGVPAYGTMLMVGFLLAVLLARMRHRSLGLEKSEIFDLGFVSVIGGIVGARVLHVIIFWRDYFESRAFWPEWMGSAGWIGAIVATWNGGLVYYGGLAGGILGLWLYARRKKIPVVDVLDFVAPGVALGLAMTRFGCFLNGCCFGRPTEMPWGVRFPEWITKVQRSHVYEHQCANHLIERGDAILAVHPAQLYEMLAALAIFAALWWLYPRRRFAGQMSCAFGLLYTVWRFCNEFFRADSGPWRPKIGERVLDLGPLTVFQYMSVPIFIVFAAALVVARRRARPPYRPDPEGAEEGRARKKRAESPPADEETKS